MPRVWQALQRGESARERRRQLERVHEEFVETSAVMLASIESDARAGGSQKLGALERLADRETASGSLAPAGVRPVVYQSWLRSIQQTIDLDRAPDTLALDEEELRELQRLHPMSRVLPVVHRLLLQEATDSGFIVAIGDAAGRLLWVDGERGLRERAEDMGFVAGMDWSEAAVGTSAPGSALVLDNAIQVLGAEHYNRSVHEWSCTAAPVHDPITGSTIGVIDVTGGDDAASPQIFPLVEATIAAVEAELKLESLRAQIARGRQKPRSSRTAASPAAAKTVVRLGVLGRDPAILEYAGATWPVSGRHAEIVVALSAATHGLTAAQLAEQVYGEGASEQTLRAEVVRLRKFLSANAVPIEIESRPYRLSGPLRIDAFDTLQALSRGAHRLALAAYEGPVLPASDAPAVRSLRLDVDATLREAMLQSAAADPLYEYAQAWAADDAEVWETLLQVLPMLSPKRARVLARLESLAPAKQ